MQFSECLQRSRASERGKAKKMRLKVTVFSSASHRAHPWKIYQCRMKHFTGNITSFFSMKFISDRGLPFFCFSILLKDIEMTKWNNVKSNEENRHDLPLEIVVRSIASLMMCLGKVFLLEVCRADRSQTHDNDGQKRKDACNCQKESTATKTG